MEGLRASCDWHQMNATWIWGWWGYKLYRWNVALYSTCPPNIHCHYWVLPGLPVLFAWGSVGSGLWIMRTLNQEVWSRYASMRTMSLSNEHKKALHYWGDPEWAPPGGVAGWNVRTVRHAVNHWQDWSHHYAVQYVNCCLVMNTKKAQHYWGNPEWAPLSGVAGQSVCSVRHAVNHLHSSCVIC